MSKWSNVPISGTHDWDRDLSNLLTGNDNASAPLEVDWTDPDAVAANREMVADAMLPALADALQGIADPVRGRAAGRPARHRRRHRGRGRGARIVHGSRHRLPDEARRAVYRVALDLTSEGYKELAEQAGAVARTVTEARECGCGNLHPCGLADGSTLFAVVEQGKPPEFRLAPWWQAEEETDE